MCACPTTTIALAFAQRLWREWTRSAWPSLLCAGHIRESISDPAIHFHNWLTTGALAGQDDGTPYLSYFAYEKTFWNARKEKNLLFVHYDDLQADLDRRDAQDRRLPRHRDF